MSHPADAGTPAGTAVEPKRVARVAKRLRAFVAEHGSGGTCVIDHLGRGGARIVTVAADGAFTDVVVGSMEQAAATCAAADLPVARWDRELSALVMVTGQDRIRMAGTGR